MFWTGLYVAVPFRAPNAFPLQAQRAMVWTEVRALSGDVVDHDVRDHEFPALAPVALAPYAHTRWEDCAPKAMLSSVQWFVAMKVDSGGPCYSSKLKNLYACSAARLAASIAAFVSLMAKASPALREVVDVDAVLVKAGVDITPCFAYVDDWDLPGFVWPVDPETGEPTDVDVRAVERDRDPAVLAADRRCLAGANALGPPPHVLHENDL